MRSMMLAAPIWQHRPSSPACDVLCGIFHLLLRDVAILVLVRQLKELVPWLLWIHGLYPRHPSESCESESKGWCMAISVCQLLDSQSLIASGTVGSGCHWAASTSHFTRPKASAHERRASRCGPCRACGSTPSSVEDTPRIHSTSEPERDLHLEAGRFAIGRRPGIRGQVPGGNELSWLRWMSLRRHTPPQ